MTRLFTMPDAWSGGDFELELFFGNISEASTSTVLNALWSHQYLDGCWLERDIEPEDQPRVAADWKKEQVEILFGVATLPNKAKCNCRSVVIHNDDGILLDLGLPLCGLGRSYPVGGYPFDDSVSWIMPISEWLVDIARSVFTVYPFELGVIGFEVDSREFSVREGDIPKKRWLGYLRNECGKLAWYPPNMLKAPFSFDG